MIRRGDVYLADLSPESSTLNWTNSMRIDIVNLRK
ncbi:phage portal family protein [Staphylococcus aureus]|nr:phage portal family protein [Staphylococcus aureus]